MTNKEYVVYDFAQAGSADELAVAFGIWLAKAAQVFTEQWARLSSVPITVEANPIRTRTYDAALSAAETTSIGCIADIESGQVASVWHIGQKDIQTIIYGLVGGSGESDSFDRGLTAIEMSLCQLFLDSLASALSEAWPSKQALTLKAGDAELNPKRLRLYRAKDLVTATGLTFKLPSGEAVMNWVLPKQQTADLLAPISDQRKGRSSGNSPQDVVDKLPIEITAVLGEANVSINRLNNLSVGDVLKLNQRIDLPVVAMIDGRPFYECWLGKVGNTQGLEISACLK